MPIKNISLFIKLLHNFKMLVGILFGSSFLSRFKEEIILEDSVLSLGVIKKIQHLKVGGNQNIFIGKSDGELSIYSKIVIKGICNFKRISV